MSKVTLRETPSEQLIKQASDITVKDASGRVFTLKEPDVFAPFALVKVVGAESAENHVYMGMILPLLYLSDIDGDPVFLPKSEREIEATIRRLGNEGVRTLRKAVEAHFGAASEEVEKAEIKK